MFCHECGKEIPGRPTYCRSCGQRIEYLGDQDSLPVKRASRARITLRDVISVLALTIVLFIILQTAAAVTARIILPADIPYSLDGRCDVCGRYSDVVLGGDGSIEHEFCFFDAIVYEMSLPARVFDLTSSPVEIKVFSQWLFLIIAVLTALELHGGFTRLWRDPSKISRQAYWRGIVSVAAGLVIWLITGCLFGLSLYHATNELMGGPLLSSLGTVQVLRIASLPFGLFWCSVHGQELMCAFRYVNLGWRVILPWSSKGDPITGAIRTTAVSFALGAILCMVSSTVLGRGYLAGSIFVMSVGIFMLVLGFWPVRDSATHPTIPS